MNVLIMGRAKTGTTVISKTIQNSLPGTTHYSLEPKNIGFFYQPEHFPDTDHQVVKIIFEHWDTAPRCRMGLIHNESPLSFDKQVCIVRDPRDELLSRLMYFIKPWKDANGLVEEKNQRWFAALEKKEQDPGSASFFDMVSTLDSIYNSNMRAAVLNEKIVQHYYRVLDNIQQPVHILKYEDFMRGNLSELENYLGFKLSNNRDVGSLGRTRRSESFNNWKQFYTPADIDLLKPVYSSILEKMGYDDWNLEQADSLNPENFSRYAERLATE